MPINQRVRDNNVFGTVTDNPLIAGATNFNSGGLINLSSVVTKHAIITLDPLRQYGAPEIVIVTLHTVSSTAATISRGAYGTIARQHPQGTLWVHAPMNEDFIQVLSSGTRPSNPYEGQFIFEMDTNKLIGYGGVDWAPRDAGGQLGYTQTTTNQTGITTSVDLTGLSAVVTVGTGRRVKITGFIPQFTRTAGTVTFVTFHILEGATELGLMTVGMNNTYCGAVCSAVITPTAGSHTYKLTANSDGTVSTTLTATSPAFILVEDIGAA